MKSSVFDTRAGLLNRVATTGLQMYKMLHCVNGTSQTQVLCCDECGESDRMGPEWLKRHCSQCQAIRRKTWNGALFRVTTRSTFWGYRKKSHPRNTCMLTIARYTYKISLPNWKQKKIQNVVVLSPFFALDTFDQSWPFPPLPPVSRFRCINDSPKKNPAAHPKFPEGRPSLLVDLDMGLATAELLRVAGAGDVAGVVVGVVAPRVQGVAAVAGVALGHAEVGEAGAGARAGGGRLAVRGRGGLRQSQVGASVVGALQVGVWRDALGDARLLGRRGRWACAAAAAAAVGWGRDGGDHGGSSDRHRRCLVPPWHCHRCGGCHRRCLVPPWNCHRCGDCHRRCLVPPWNCHRRCLVLPWKRHRRWNRHRR